MKKLTLLFMLFMATALFSLCRCTAGKNGEPAAPVRASFKTADEKARFNEAWQTINDPQPDYARALKLLETNIAEHPDRVDIDYEYGWAVLCCAKLGRYKDVLHYYEILRRDYSGPVATVSDQPNTAFQVRNWESQLAEARKLTEAANTDEAKMAAARMAELDGAYEAIKMKSKEVKIDKDLTITLQADGGIHVNER